MKPFTLRFLLFKNANGNATYRPDRTSLFRAPIHLNPSELPSPLPPSLTITISAGPSTTAPSET